MMKIHTALIIFLLTGRVLYSQNTVDSLVLYSDLKFSSDFEKTAFQNFVYHNNDTFDLFLAIDKTMDAKKAERCDSIYESIYKDLDRRRLESKNMNKRIKITYTSVQAKFLKKYNNNEFFPVTLETGSFNCVTASMLYSLVFRQLNIPYKVMASPRHVYLVANPGPQSIVIETTDPVFESVIFNGEFKRQYVNYLKESKLISENDYRNKSVDEIFQTQFKKVDEVPFINLPGFQYYNKAVAEYQDHNVKTAYELCQKAYFFSPDQQVKTLLYITLLAQIQKCDFDQVSDIDYLAQLSRFDDIDRNAFIKFFHDIILNNLQYTDKEALCDSLYFRLAPQINDKKTREELSFSYYMLMSYHYQHSEKMGYYIENAMKIKSNQQDANEMFIYYIQRKLNLIDNPEQLLDTVLMYERKFDYEMVRPVLKEKEMYAYLKIAEDRFKDHDFNSTEKYLKLFENNCSLPIQSNRLSYQVEMTYRTIAVYYFYQHNKTKAQTYIDRGLKFVPGSRLIKSAVY